MEFRLQLPQNEIELFAESRFSEGVDTIFVGHFHQEFLYRNPESKALFVVPDWFSTQKVTVYHSDSKEITLIHWKELKSAGVELRCAVRSKSSKNKKKLPGDDGTEGKNYT